MQLQFVRPHISIQAFDSVDLPSFTIMTGLNGSGKTHLLEAIRDGNSLIDGLSSNSVKYYNLAEFQVTEAGAQSEQQLNQLRQQSWNVLHSSPWKQVWEQAFAKCFIENTGDGKIDHFEKEKLEKVSVWSASSAKKNERIKQYQDQIQSQIFDAEKFKQQPYSVAIIKAIKKSRLPVNKVSRDDFDGFYTPTIDSNNFLSLSIGAIFTNYKLTQYKYIHDRIERGESWDSLKKEFEKKYPKPWLIFNKILEEIHLSGGGDNVFNFVISDPEDDKLKMGSWQNYAFQPVLRDKKDKLPRNFGNLSSGEKVLLALAVSLYEAAEYFSFPKLFLLDEIDATLHPSMIRSLLNTLQQVFVANGTNVILATHSPTTIALAPSESIFVVNKGNSKKKIEHQSQSKALEILTEGYATLDEGLSLFDQISTDDICLITEGKNSELIERAFQLLGEKKINIISCFKGGSGKDQLKTLYQFFTKADHKSKVLFVWDCDAAGIANGQSEENNTFRYALPENPENGIATRGIENMFPESAFGSSYTETVIDDETGEKRKQFKPNRKNAFGKKMLTKGTKQDFSNFDQLLQKIKDVRQA